MKDGDILYDSSQRLLSCVCSCHKLYHHIFYTASGLENDSTLGQFHTKYWMFFLQILEGNGHKRTQREGLCTGTAKSEPRYDIYLEQTAVYRYIGAALDTIKILSIGTDISEQTVQT